MQDREEIIEQVGEYEFFHNENYSELWDIDIPTCFIFEFNTYLEIYKMSGDSVTWCDIEAYCNVRRLCLSQREIDVIISINRMAVSEIARLKEDED